MKFQTIVGLGLDQLHNEERFLEHVRKATLAHIHVLAEQFAMPYSAAIGDYFLFTTIVLILTRDSTLDTLPILIGSDGVADMLSRQDEKLPGKDILLGPPQQFFDDKYFVNDDAVGRHLRLANSDVTRLDSSQSPPRPVTHRALLPDDTTLIAVRRRRDATVS